MGRGRTSTIARSAASRSPSPTKPALLSMMGATVAGSLAGEAILSRKFQAPEPTNEEELAQMRPVMEPSPCANQFHNFEKCMHSTNDDPVACQGEWECVAECRERATEMMRQRELLRDI